MGCNQSFIQSEVKDREGSLGGALRPDVRGPRGPEAVTKETEAHLLIPVIQPK